MRRAQEDNYVGFILAKKLEKPEFLTDKNGTVDLFIEGKGVGGEAYISLKVEGASDLSDAILDEFRRALGAIGLNGDLVDKCSFKKFAESRGSRLVPAYRIEGDDIKKALKAELEWLSRNGVVSGLSKADIENIVSAAKLGCAGWNSRLVWSNGRWTPYRLTEGAVVLRCILAPPVFYYTGEELGGPGQPSPDHSTVAGSSGHEPLTTTVYIAASAAVALLASAAAYILIKRNIP